MKTDFVKATGVKLLLFFGFLGHIATTGLCANLDTKTKAALVGAVAGTAGLIGGQVWRARLKNSLKKQAFNAQRAAEIRKRIRMANWFSGGSAIFGLFSGGYAAAKLRSSGQVSPGGNGDNRASLTRLPSLNASSTVIPDVDPVQGPVSTSSARLSDTQRNSAGNGTVLPAAPVRVQVNGPQAGTPDVPVNTAATNGDGGDTRPPAPLRGCEPEESESSDSGNEDPEEAARITRRRRDTVIAQALQDAFAQMVTDNADENNQELTNAYQTVCLYNNTRGTIDAGLVKAETFQDAQDAIAEWKRENSPARRAEKIRKERLLADVLKRKIFQNHHYAWHMREKIFADPYSAADLHCASDLDTVYANFRCASRTADRSQLYDNNNNVIDLALPAGTGRDRYEERQVQGKAIRVHYQRAPSAAEQARARASFAASQRYARGERVRLYAAWLNSKRHDFDGVSDKEIIARFIRGWGLLPHGTDPIEGQPYERKTIQDFVGRGVDTSPLEWIDASEEDSE